MSEVAVLHAILNELCAEIPLTDVGTRTNVACALLAASHAGALSLDDLRQAGSLALQQVPSMRRDAGRPIQ
jgi:hypothetical protein